MKNILLTGAIICGILIFTKPSKEACVKEILPEICAQIHKENPLMGTICDGINGTIGSNIEKVLPVITRADDRIFYVDYSTSVLGLVEIKTFGVANTCIVHSIKGGN